MNIILFKTLLLQGELIRASAENGFIMNKGNLIIQDVKRTSAGESLTWFMRIQKSVLHVFQLKYSIGIYYYFLMNTSWNKILKIEVMSNGTHFLATDLLRFYSSHKARFIFTWILLQTKHARKGSISFVSKFQKGHSLHHWWIYL